MNAFGGEPVAVKKPSAELVTKIAESVCTALTLAGVGAYEAWASNPSNVENEELADLVIMMKVGKVIKEISEDMAFKVVFVTGDTVSAGMRDFIAATGNPVLAKPFRMAELLRTIQELWDRTPATV